MRRARLRTVLVAAACAAGLVTSGVGLVAGSASASAASSGTASATTARAVADTVLPPHVFAPYIGPSDNLEQTAAAAGTQYLTLDFLQTPQPGSCTVDWNGDPSTPVGDYASGIAAVQAAGGQVVPSFGGAAADSNGTELADSCHRVGAIAAAYENVITTYHVTRLDLDTEEDSLNNYAGIERRNAAIAQVERWAARTGRTVQFVYTIPTNTTGIDQGGAYVLANAVQQHARIAVVDIMTFDFYDGMPHEMASNTQSAVTDIYNVLHRLYPAKSPTRLWAMIGLCEDIGSPRHPGRDDYGAAETFTVTDAHIVEQWAAAHRLAELTFWNLASDNGAAAPYQYSHAFEPFTGSSEPRHGSAVVPGLAGSGRGAPGHGAARGADPATGNLRTVSCPTPTFCLAVGEYGNTSIAWNGQSWSRPVLADPGGSKVEITSVSCATARDCVAADTVGRVLRWTGRSWSRPVPVDPGTGLTSVSCPAADAGQFCVAVGGNGTAVLYRHGAWSHPVQIDSTGAGLQSVSCASATFCAVGDWAGNAVRFNGTTWTAPASLETTTDSAGGGLGAMSCPTAAFCVAVDWEGSEITWNGTTWGTSDPFDPDGAGGLISVSCRSASFCMAVDGSGDALTWDGSAWTSASVDTTGDGTESVSCATTQFCMAVDWNGNALRYNGTTWTAPAVSCPDSSSSSAGTCTLTGTFTDPRAGVLSAVSCPTAGFCAAVDENGNALIRRGARWSGPVLIDPIAGVLTSVSCASPAFCAAVDINGRAFTWNGTSWSLPAFSATSPADPAGGALTAVSCPAAAQGQFCAAVDSGGNAITWNGTTWTAPAPIDPNGGGLTGVSCTSATACVAVDADGNALTWNGTTWSAPAPIDPNGAGLTSVACWSAGCVAVDANGNAVTETTSAWSTPVAIDPHGNGLTSVTCTPNGRCTAADWNGNVLTNHGARWSRPRPVDRDGGGLQAISCPPHAPACAAVDWDGRALAVRAA